MVALARESLVRVADVSQNIQSMVSKQRLQRM